MPSLLPFGVTPDASLPPADVQRPTPPLTDFDKQVAQFNEVMAMSDEEVERLANKVRSLSATPPLTDEELAEIDARDQALGAVPLTTTLSVSRQVDDAPEFGTSRFVPTGRRASIEVTADEVVVLRIEDGEGFTCTEPHLSSWGEAAADRRRLIADLRASRAEVERLRAAPTICEWGGEFDVPPCDQPAASPIVFFGRPKVWLCQEHFGRGNLLATPEVVQELTAEVERLRNELDHMEADAAGLPVEMIRAERQ